MRSRSRSRLDAIIRLRCPNCREGPVWSGALTMYERCPACAIRFEREPGYFTGAMLASYAIGVPMLGMLLVIVWFATRWNVEWVFALAIPAYVAITPLIFRYSRVVWMHVDWSLDPGNR